MLLLPLLRHIIASSRVESFVIRLASVCGAKVRHYLPPCCCIVAARSAAAESPLDDTKRAAAAAAAALDNTVAPASLPVEWDSNGAYLFCCCKVFIGVYEFVVADVVIIIIVVAVVIIS